jgi:hypothetical protein
MDRRPSSVLDVIEIRVPCTASWEEMRGDDRSRFCRHCRQRVYNLSKMSEADAVTLVQRGGRRPCLRFYRRPDGTVMTNDCRTLMRALRRKLASGTALAIALVLALLGLLAIPTSQRATPQQLRHVEPFRMILEWIDPSPPPPIMGF